jgi:hypothetical protein
MTTNLLCSIDAAYPSWPAVETANLTRQRDHVIEPLTQAVQDRLLDDLGAALEQPGYW